MNATEWIHCPVCGNKTRLQYGKIQNGRIFHFTVQGLKRKHKADWQSDQLEI